MHGILIWFYVWYYCLYFCSILALVIKVVFDLNILRSYFFENGSVVMWHKEFHTFTSLISTKFVIFSSTKDYTNHNQHFLQWNGDETGFFTLIVWSSYKWNQSVQTWSKSFSESHLLEHIGWCMKMMSMFIVSIPIKMKYWRLWFWQLKRPRNFHETPLLLRVCIISNRNLVHNPHGKTIITAFHDCYEQLNHSQRNFPIFVNWKVNW